MRIFRPILLVAFFLFSINAFAVVTPVTTDPVPKTDIATIKIKEFEKLTGKKLTLFQKIKFKLIQKKLLKIKSGQEMTEQQKKWAQLSMIFGIGSVVLVGLSAIFIVGVLSLMAIPVAILAIIYGAKSLKGNSNKKGIIGIITGGITLALVITAFIILASAFSGFRFE